MAAKTVGLFAVFALSLATSFPACAHKLPSGAQVTLIARMADTFAIHWQEPQADTSSGAAESLSRTLEFHVVGHLIPGASLSRSCVLHRRRSVPTVVTANPPAAILPRANAEIENEICSAKLQALSGNSTETLALHIASLETAGTLASARLDIFFSAI